MTIRKLHQGERDALRHHLLRLTPKHRRMRFRGSVNYNFIQSYCDQIDWLRTTILGDFTDGELRGVAELTQAGDRWPNFAELALTVEGPFQNQGIGTQLLKKSLVMAQNRFVSTVYMFCLLDNQKMRRIAENCGAYLVVHEGEMEGRLWPPWPSYLSVAEEAATEAQTIFRPVFDALSNRTSILNEAV